MIYYCFNTCMFYIGGSECYGLKFLDGSAFQV